MLSFVCRARYVVESPKFDKLRVKFADFLFYRFKQKKTYKKIEVGSLGMTAQLSDTAVDEGFCLEWSAKPACPTSLMCLFVCF